MLKNKIKYIDHNEKYIFNSIKASNPKIVLFGAGEIAMYIMQSLKEYDISIDCFCDNSKDKQGKLYLGLPVYSYPQMRERLLGEEYNIIIATGAKNENEIRQQLINLGEVNPIWHLKDFEVIGPKFNYEYFVENIDAFEEVYSLLEDNYSKEVFISIVKAKISGDLSYYEDIMTNDQYFDPSIVTLRNNEVFLDVGAYNGNDIIEFAKRTNYKYKRIIAIEPDADIFQDLEKRLKNNNIRDCKLYNIGAWSSNGYLRFCGDSVGRSQFRISNNDTLKEVSLEVNSIDNILNGDSVSYLQMDIEGSEHQALLGAKQTIQKYKPTIAISVYHKREDLFDLPLLLHDFVSEYKFYLRHYTNLQFETVLYAIADKGINNE